MSRRSGGRMCPGLSPAEAERLAILAEECAEVIKAVSKIQRHGYESVNPDGDHTWTNRNDLEKELGDVLYAMEMMLKARDVSDMEIEGAKMMKADSIKPYLHHQEV